MQSRDFVKKVINETSPEFARDRQDAGGARFRLCESRRIFDPRQIAELKVAIGGSAAGYSRGRRKAAASGHIYKFTPQMRIMAPIHDI